MQHWLQAQTARYRHLMPKSTVIPRNGQIVVATLNEPDVMLIP